MPPRTLPPDHIDRDLDGARHDPDRLDGVLGADGLCHHGRLLVATILTLIFLPTLYVTWFGWREGKQGDGPAKAPVPVTE